MGGGGSKPLRINYLPAKPKALYRTGYFGPSVGERMKEVSKDKASLGEPSLWGGGSREQTGAPRWDWGIGTAPDIPVPVSA